MDTIKGNKLIADWMETGSLSDRYDTSWDCLMPVIDKIESNPAYIFNIEGNSATIIGYGAGSFAHTVVDSKTRSKINAAWTLALEFILWHNKQLK